MLSILTVLWKRGYIVVSAPGFRFDVQQEDGKGAGSGMVTALYATSVLS